MHSAYLSYLLFKNIFASVTRDKYTRAADYKLYNHTMHDFVNHDDWLYTIIIKQKKHLHPFLKINKYVILLYLPENDRYNLTGV